MAVQRKIIHKIKEDEVKQCWEFGLKYFLDNKKSIQNRTVGQNRGVGGILDSFMNKIIEIAVCKEISKINKNIECFSDFEIHQLKKGKTEPDVFKVKEKTESVKRDPRVYVEIKNITDGDNWLGPKADELESIQNNEYGIKDTKKMFYVYGEIIDSRKEKNSRKSSILGAFLKKVIPKDATLKQFHDIADLSVEIKYVLSINDIQKMGVHFPAGGYMTNPEIFAEPSKKRKKTILKNMKSGKYTAVSTPNNTFPKETGSFLTEKNGSKTVKKSLPYPESFGEIKYSGQLEMHQEDLSSLTNRFFHCLSKVRVSHSVLGDWEFDKGDVQNFKITYSGRDPQLRKDNTFIARRNEKIAKKLCASRLGEIAKSI